MAVRDSSHLRSAKSGFDRNSHRVRMSRCYYSGFLVLDAEEGRFSSEESVLGLVQNRDLPTHGLLFSRTRVAFIRSLYRRLKPCRIPSQSSVSLQAWAQATPAS